MIFQPWSFIIIALAIWVFLCFQYEFEICCCCCSVKNAIEILVGNMLNLYFYFCYIAVFTVWNLPIYAHGLSLHLLVYSLTSFSCALKFHYQLFLTPPFLYLKIFLNCCDRNFPPYVYIEREVTLVYWFCSLLLCCLIKSKMVLVYCLLLWENNLVKSNLRKEECIWLTVLGYVVNWCREIQAET